MKKLFWKIIIILWLIGINLSIIFAITIQVPTPSGQEDIIITWTTQVESDESTIFDVIQIINDYLWFTVAGVAMVVLVYAGLKLIWAQWDKEAVSAANKMIVSAMIAIFVAILSYAIIKLVVNLF